MLRTALLVVAGGLMVGCESSNVSGNYSYRDRVDGNPTFRGDRVDGDYAYNSAPARTDVALSRGHRDRTGPEEFHRSGPDYDADANRGVDTARVAGATIPRDADARPDFSSDQKPERERYEFHKSGPDYDRGGGISGGGRVITDGDRADVNRDAKAGWADPERASYASTARFPNDMKAVDDTRLSASVDKSNGTIVVRNNTDQAMRDLKVWVNGSYVTQVNEIPSNSSVTLDRYHFSNSDGRMFTDFNNVSQIQVQAKDTLYNVTYR